MSEIHGPTPPADDGRSNQTAEALIGYADLVSRHGLESAEARAYFAQHQHLPEFQELAAETQRLEMQFHKQVRRSARPARPTWLPFAAAVTGAMVLIGSLGGLYFSMDRAQQLAGELASVKKENEQLVAKVADLQNQSARAGKAKGPEVVRTIARLETLSNQAGASREYSPEEGEWLKDQIMSYHQQLAKDPQFYADLAVRKEDPGFALDSVVAFDRAGQEAGNEPAFIAAIHSVRDQYPNAPMVQRRADQALKNLQARLP